MEDYFRKKVKICVKTGVVLLIIFKKLALWETFQIPWCPIQLHTIPDVE